MIIKQHSALNIGGKKRIMGEKILTAQVMMVGGRRCGKTSILAAMKENFEDLFSKTELTLSIGDLDTLDVLEKKNNEINDYFRGAANRTFTPDSNPTEEIMHYLFNVGIAGKESKIGVDFVDYPGEWLTDSEKKKELLDCMKKSQAIIIAIDTPHMIEENGRFNEYRNFCYRTSEMLKMAFEEANPAHMLVLFVPLKCECYMAKEKMELVRERTEESYESLIQYLQQHPKQYQVAVTPIFTMGGAAFSHFERDRQTMEIAVDPVYNTPKKAIYCFPDVNVKKPEPKYCEQPIVWLMAYLLQLAGNEKAAQSGRAGLWKWVRIEVQDFMFSNAKAADYLKHKQVLLKNLKREKDGYHVVQNPMKF